MTFVLLCIFALICFGLVGWGMTARGRFYEFPFLAGGTFLGFVLPQLIGLSHNQDLPSGALDKTVVMAILCAGMCYCGYLWRPRALQHFDWQLSSPRLLRASLLLVLFGAYFFFALSRLPEEMKEVSTWSGRPVAYLFFAQTLSYGFAVAFLLFVTSRSRVALAIAVFAAVFYLDRILLAGRRGVTLEFGFIILLSLWFGRGWSIPRPIALAGLILGTLALHSTGEYRAATANTQESKWQQIRSIPFLDNLQQQLSHGGSELENAVYYIAAVDETKQFDYGVFHWNTLVFNYVPAQLLGSEFKQSLTIPVEEVDTYLMYGHSPRLGSTITGLVDAFGSFWFFGCLKFFVIGFVLRRLYQAAVEGHFVARLLYMLIITSALHTITHHTQWFVSPWLHISVFLVPALYFSRDWRSPALVPFPATGTLPEADIHPAAP